MHAQKEISMEGNRGKSKKKTNTNQATIVRGSLFSLLIFLRNDIP